MLNKLNEVMTLLPGFLKEPWRWDSLLINRRKPWTWRVFADLGDGYRVCLHRFEPCHTHEAFEHPHPWPGAFMLLSGAYKMRVLKSADRTSKPFPVAEFVLRAGSAYEITEPTTWHSVIPLETTYTVMVNGPPWPADYAHVDVRTTKGKDLEKLSEEELAIHLADFRELVSAYLEHRMVL